MHRTTHRCPDEETLAAYFDGLMPPGEEAALHRELVACPDCARLVAALGVVIEAEAPGAADTWAVPAALTRRAQALWPSEPLVERVQRGLRLAARWVDDALQPLADALAPPQLATVAVRGAARPAAHDELRYELTVGDLPVAIDLEVDGPSQIALTVRPLHAPPPGLMLRVSAAGQTRALSSLTADGATVPALPAGDYELAIERPDGPLGHVTLALEAATD